MLTVIIAAAEAAIVNAVIGTYNDKFV